jgi:hypothetical protein
MNSDNDTDKAIIQKMETIINQLKAKLKSVLVKTENN